MHNMNSGKIQQWAEVGEVKFCLEYVRVQYALYIFDEFEVSEWDACYKELRKLNSVLQNGNFKF